MEPPWTGLLRALLYGVQFETNLLNGVDRTLENVVGRRALGAEPKEYLDGVRNALKSAIALSTLLPLDHSESDVRRYLQVIAHRLEEEGGM
jgi:hypothetical protein